MDLSRRNSKCTELDSFLASLSKGIIMDINRNKRKNRNGDEQGEFSQQSILSAMDRFVQAVNNMDETVMVPSRLMDMSLDNNDDSKPAPNTTSTVAVPRSVMNTDLFAFYNMLNAVKNELIWGPADGHAKEEKTNKRTHSRRPSSVSVHSYSDSDLESESSTEFDSGVEMDEQSSQVAGAFREHLTGLFQALQQLTDAANYLSTRYQNEVEPSTS